MEFMTDNELIAEFMGLKSFEDSRYGTLWPSPLKAKTPATCFGLCYHESWDWLMPVVEKICNLWRENVDQQNKPTTVKERDFDNAASKVTMLSIDCGVNAAYINVVEFIKWYNNEKATPNP